MSPRRLPQRQRDRLTPSSAGMSGGMGDFIRFMSNDHPADPDQAPGRIVRAPDDFARPCSIDPPGPAHPAEWRIAG